MKLVVVALVSVLAITSSSNVLDLNDVNEEDTELKDIVDEYNRYYETLPQDLKEDAHLLVPELVQKYGYPCERHTVTTKDGYVLELHRIPYGKDGPTENRSAVFIQHGLLGSSADWVIPGPGKGFPYILVDNGYDVWLANARGTRYSRKHVTLDPDKDVKKFWKFSWHEIALDDVPATVDYVRNHTNQDKVFYIGHSQGTTVSYIMLSKLPEYNERFRAVFSLAPVAYMTGMRSPHLRLLAKYERSVNVLAKIIGLYEYRPRSEFRAKIAPILCGDESIFQILCVNVLFSICKQMNTTLLPVIMGHTPAGAASKQLLHYAQGFNSGNFREWDYGKIGNILHYGQLSPPRYELENIRAPVYMYYSRNDWLSHEDDVNRLAIQISSLKGKFLVNDEQFNHIDYIYAIDAPNLVFKRIIDLMRGH